MKAPLRIIRDLLLVSGLLLAFPSAYGAAICDSSSSTSASDTLTDSGGSGSNYSNNEFCDFLIQPTGASSVTLTFSAFDLESGFDFLTVYDGSTSGSTVLANNLSGTSLPGSVTSSGGAMLVRFSSDSSVTRSGFVASWTSATTSSVAMCGSSSSTSSSDTLTDSGGSGSNYSNNEFCDFLIQPTGASSVTLIFSAFNLESGFDFLTVYDGSTSGSTVLANNLSGTSLPSSVTSTGGAMLVRFSSDSSVTRSGFVASWTSTTGVSCLAQSVGDNFPSVSYSQNSGSQNWTGDWTEVGESDGTSAGIARVRSDLCTSGNCLRFGVPSGSSAQTYSDRGVYRQADLSTVTSATLSFVYRSGVNQGSQTVVLAASNDGGSTWTDLQSYFMSSSNTSATTASFDISAYTASDTQIRFLATGSNAVVGMYIDDISINYQPSCSPTAVIDHHFDELNWDGTADEVLDNSGNSNHAMTDAAGGLTTVDPGQVCRAGQFDGTNDYIESSSIFSTLRTTASLSFWLKTTQTGNNTTYLAPGITGSEQDGGTDDIFWGWLDASGRIGVSATDTLDSKSTVAINDGIYHHIVLSRDSPSGAFKIYIDGSLDNSGTTGAGDIGTTFSSIGRIENTGGAHKYFQGDLDEVLVFDVVLSDAQVNTIYTEQLAGNNFDGSTRTCPVLATPLLEYRFEEDTWNGTAGEILDNTGNGHHAQLNNSSTPETASPALTGDPGTCGYASQNDGSIQVTGLPLDTSTTGVKTTVTFWMNWDSTNDNVMPIGWNFHDIWIFNGSIGFNTWNNDIYGISSASLANSWHHIAVEFTNGSVTSNRMYVDGVEQTLTQLRGSPNNANAFVNSEMRIGGVSNSTSYDFHGLIDEVRVYESALSTAQINTIMTESHPCSVVALDHFTVNHDTTGIHCAAEPVSVTARNADDTVTTGYTGSITLDTQTANGTWSLVTGAGVFSDAIDNDGLATYTFAAADNGVASFSLYYPEGTASFDIDAFDGAIRDDDLESDITFAASGFTITNSELITPPPNDPISTQIAGTTFNVHVAAFGTLPNDSACGIIETYTGSKNLTLSTTYLNPSSGTIDALSNVSATPTIIFSSGKAELPVKYKDVGEIRIGISDGTISGDSNNFVVRPASFEITPGGSNSTAADHNGSVYTSAGTDFAVTVTVKDSEDSTTPNYGNESTPETISLTSALNQPVGGSIGTFTSSLSRTGSGIFSGNSNWSEVGIIDLTAAVGDADYLDTGNVTTTLTNVGRFVPASFYVAVTNAGMLENTCTTGTTPFTYIGQDFGYQDAPSFSVTARNVSLATTTNYRGLFVKLDGNSITVSNVTTDTSNQGSDLALLDVNFTTAAMSVTPDNLGVVNYVFGADRYRYGPDPALLSYSKEPNSEVTPFTADINRTITLVDDGDTSTVVNQAVDIAGNEQRFGRLKMSNVHGSELANLQMPMVVEYLSVSGFTINTDDNNCTQIVDSDLTVTPNLRSPGVSTVSVTNPGSTLGDHGITLTAPGSGLDGNVLVSPNLDTSLDKWLRYDWDSDGNFDDDPSATATFGIYKGNPVNIYIQQTYQ